MRALKTIRRWLFRTFGRTQRVPPIRTPRRLRVAGPAVAAFDSELAAAEQGYEWGPDDPDRWQWLVQVGGGPAGSAPAVSTPDTPIPPAPAVTDRRTDIKLFPKEQDTLRILPVHPRLVSRVRK